MPDYSVVIPTYNRMDTLPEVLDALDAQEGAPDFELIVVDDGSDDGTWSFLEGRRSHVPTTKLRQENAGPARARNWGVERASGDRVAFLGDDTVPQRGWLRAHAEAARSPGEHSLLAVIGYTAWHPRMRLTPFLRYINEFGLQFGYALIDDPEDVPFNFFYTSNLSLPRQALLEEPFDLGFPYPAWEDIELAYRLEKKGMRLLYRPEARVLHDHPTDLRRFMGRQEKAGYSAVVFHQLHPELGGFLGLGPGGPPPMPSVPRQRFRERLARILHYSRVPMKAPRLWEDIMRFYYIAGLHRGWQERVVQGTAQWRGSAGGSGGPQRTRRTP